MSKRSINRELYKAGVPGATRAGAKKANPHDHAHDYRGHDCPVCYTAECECGPGYTCEACLAFAPDVRRNVQPQYDTSLTYCGCCGMPPGVCPCPHGHDPFAHPGGPDGTCHGGATAVKKNPWFSPPALQYVARFAGNPKAPTPAPFLEWGTKTRGHGVLDYTDGYSGPPGYAPPGQGPLSNPRPFRTGDRVTWSDEALDLDMGRRGQIMTVEGKSLHAADEGRTRIVTERGHRRQVNDWEIVHATGANPHDVLCQCGWGRLGMEEGEIPDRCPVCNHAIGICESCGDRKSECECGGHTHGTGRHPLSDYYREQGMRDAEDPDYDSYPYPNPPVRSNACYGLHFHQDKPFDPPAELLERLPGTGRASQWSGRSNPEYFSRAQGTARPFSRGSMHRAMETDPMHASRMKGMLAFYGKSAFGVELTSRQIESMLGKAPKDIKGTATAKSSVKKHYVGKRKVPVGPVKKGQRVELADVKRRVDAIFYAQSRGLRTLPGVSISESTVPAPAKGRKRAPKTKLPKRKKAKKKAKKRKRANPPPAAARCVSKKKDGKRCKGKKHPGEQTCVFHTKRFAPR
jgi:hypothetical protein